MLLFLHIFIALSGLVTSGISYLNPSQTKIYTSYALLMGTLLSGVLLIVVNSASILHTCVSGLTFTAIMYVGIYAAQHKLSHHS